MVGMEYVGLTREAVLSFSVLCPWLGPAPSLFSWAWKTQKLNKTKSSPHGSVSKEQDMGSGVDICEPVVVVIPALELKA